MPIRLARQISKRERAVSRRADAFVHALSAVADEVRALPRSGGKRECSAEADSRGNGRRSKLIRLTTVASSLDGLLRGQLHFLNGRFSTHSCSKMGANVVASARNEARLAETLAAMDSAGTHRSVVADLSDSTAIAALAESVETPLDGVVQCAGLTMLKPFQFLSESDVNAVMSVNFYVPVVLSRHLLKKKKLANPSSIVFVSSINGVNVASVGTSVYAASKGAINGIAKTMALELAVKGVRVNCVNPGMVETAILSEDDFTQEQKSEDAKRYPLKRYGKPEESRRKSAFVRAASQARMRRLRTWRSARRNGFSRRCRN